MLKTILRPPVRRGQGPWFSRHAVIITWTTMFVYAMGWLVCSLGIKPGHTLLWLHTKGSEDVHTPLPQLVGHSVISGFFFCKEPPEITDRMAYCCYHKIALNRFWHIGGGSEQVFSSLFLGTWCAVFNLLLHQIIVQRIMHAVYVSRYLGIKWLRSKTCMRSNFCHAAIRE